MKKLILLSIFCLSLGHSLWGGSVSEIKIPPADGKLRIICFGAHPDDCEIQAGGTAARWAAKGHHVLFVSVTNGDIGHWKEAGGPLALRRRKEVNEAHKLLGIQGVILDIHDGELLPTIENRRMLTRLIREWKADVVMGHRPNDYHPDHRYTGVLVQDAAYMVTVPNFCPDVPHLTKNPYFFYFPDRFLKPNEFKPDVLVAIDETIDKKLNALAVMESQFLEGGANGTEAISPVEPEKRAERQKQVRENFTKRQQGLTERFKSKIGQFYPGEKGSRIKFVEAFELCEYGSQANSNEIKRLFPFFN